MSHLNRGEKFLFFSLSILLSLLLCYQAFTEEKKSISTANPPAQETKKPKIQFQENFFDFGKIEQQKTVSHIFKFKNTGTSDLIIDNLKSTCGCTAALVTSKVIPPGASGEIKVTFSSKNFQGEVKRSVYVFSNDPQNSKYTLNIKAYVRAFLEAKPKYIDFGNFKKGESVSKSLVVKNLTNEPITIKDIRSDLKEIKIANFEKEINPNEETVINLTLNLSQPPGNFFGNIEITSAEHPDEKLIVPASGRIIGDITVTPENLYFGIVKKGEKSEQKIKVTNNSETALRLIEVRSTLEFIKPNFNGKPIPPKENVELTLSLLPTAPAGSFKGKIDIKTDNKVQPMLSSMLYGVVKD